MLSSASATATLDSTPEFYHYEDTGCEVSNSCLNCPLPRCKHDDPVWFQRNRRLARDFNVLTAIRVESLTIEEAAERFSVTERTIFRILRRCRDGMPEMGNLETRELQAFAAD